MPRITIMQTLRLILSLLLFEQTAFAVQDIIRGEDHFEFTYRATLPSLDQKSRLWVPLAKTDPFQTVEIERISLPSGWQKIEDTDYKNQIAVSTIGPADSGKTIEIDYKVVRREKASYAAAGDSTRSMQPELLVPRNQTFISLARDATLGKGTLIARQ
jgi:hypothetical protein